MHLKWVLNWGVRIQICFMALLQVANMHPSRHFSSGSAPFKTSFVLTGDYATRRSAALVSLPLVANQHDGLLMDEDDLESASDELTTRELDYLQKNSQPHMSSLERRNGAETSPKASAESSELASIEVEDPMTSSSAETAGTSVTIAVTTSAPTSTTHQPTTTTTTTTTTSAPPETSTNKPEPNGTTVQVEVTDSTNVRSAVKEKLTATLSSEAKLKVPVTTSTASSPVSVNVTQVMTTVNPIQLTSTTNYNLTKTSRANISEINVTSTETTTIFTTKSMPTTVSVPTTTVKPAVAEVNRTGRLCDLSRAGGGCSFTIAEVPVLEAQLDINRAHNNNKTRVVSEFVIVPSDSPLTFEDSAYPARLSNETELRAEHRTVEGDEVEVDYISSDNDTTTKINSEVPKTLASPTSPPSTTTTTTSTSPPSTTTTTTTTSTTTAAPPSSTMVLSTSTTVRPSSASMAHIIQQMSATLVPITTRNPSRLNQKFLRFTDAPASVTSSSRSTVSSGASRYSPPRVSTTRSSSHRQFFSEPESEPRRRHKYASIAADEEEMKILTRYPIISQLSRLSGSSGSGSQRAVTQSPVMQLLAKKQAIQHNHQPLVDSETMMRRQVFSTKIPQQFATKSSTTTTSMATTSGVSTLKTIPRAPSTTTIATTAEATTTTTTAKSTTAMTSVKPLSTNTTTTTAATTIAPSTKPTLTSATSSAKSDFNYSPAGNPEERLTLIAVSENHSNRSSAPPAQATVAGDRKRGTQQVVSFTQKLPGERPLRGAEFSEEFELGSIEDQLAKDALHQRKSPAEESRRARTTKYTNRQRPLNQQQQVAILESGLWLPGGADELMLSSMADESGGSTGDLLPGKPGLDYPVHVDIPRTSFDCRNYEQSGFYADVESGCQAYHSCHKGRGGRHTFMCPNGTLFSQELLTCDWWYNVECSTSKLYFGADGTYNSGSSLGLDLLP